MRVDLDIPGGPISVVLAKVEHHDGLSLSLGWWTVGGRKLCCSKKGDEPWRLTGHGIPARRTRSERFGPPPKSLRVAFRAYLLSKYRAGDCISPYSTDYGSLFASSPTCGWGWSDSNVWIWRTPHDGSGTLTKADAVRWMRAQAAKVGVRIREEDEPDPE